MRKLGLLLVLLLLSLFSSPFFPAQHASAATVTVINASSADVHKLELKNGQAADIVVYLSSFGDLVENFLVILRRESDNKRIRTLLSDKHGRVRFRIIPPGNYRVYVSRRVSDDGHLSTVEVGDIRVVPSKRKRK